MFKWDVFIFIAVRSFSIRTYHRDFPGSPVVKNPPSNAGDTDSISGRGTEIPHATGQLSSCATTTEHSGHN